MEQLKKDLRVALDAMRPRHYQDSSERWGEPTDGQMLATCAGSFAFWMLLFWGAF